VLAICGKVEGITALLSKAEAEALSVDQSNDLQALRAALPHSLLFGNLDPVQILAKGSVEQVQRATRLALSAGADALWPGCDLYPDTPLANLRAMLAECRQISLEQYK
jgi:[methyl-Co(III) methanol-specific corrinoid protein]:coenzyme M methyltransferase